MGKKQDRNRRWITSLSSFERDGIELRAPKPEHTVFRFGGSDPSRALHVLRLPTSALNLEAIILMSILSLLHFSTDPLVLQRDFVGYS